MGWSFRRALKIGPFRINLSKAGVGASAGVKGGRVSVGPAGVRATLTPLAGVTYRKQLSNRKWWKFWKK